MPNHSFSEVILPNIQTDPPLTQLEAIPSSPVISYLKEVANLHLTTASFQVVVESNKISQYRMNCLQEQGKPQFIKKKKKTTAAKEGKSHLHSQVMPGPISQISSPQCMHTYGCEAVP